jgi:hypothetical protein
MEASAGIIWGVPSLIKRAFIYGGCTIWMLLILGLLDVNEYWGSCWGRCVSEEHPAKYNLAFQKLSLQGDMGGAVLLEVVLVRCENVTHQHPRWHLLCLCSLMSVISGAYVPFTCPLPCLQGLFQINRISYRPCENLCKMTMWIPC